MIRSPELDRDMLNPVRKPRDTLSSGLRPYSKSLVHSFCGESGSSPKGIETKARFATVAAPSVPIQADGFGRFVTALCTESRILQYLNMFGCELSFVPKVSFERGTLS